MVAPQLVAAAAQLVVATRVASSLLVRCEIRRSHARRGRGGHHDEIPAITNTHSKNRANIPKRIASGRSSLCTPLSCAIAAFPIRHLRTTQRRSRVATARPQRRTQSRLPIFVSESGGLRRCRNRLMATFLVTRASSAPWRGVMRRWRRDGREASPKPMFSCAPSVATPLTASAFFPNAIAVPTPRVASVTYLIDDQNTPTR